MFGSFIKTVKDDETHKFTNFTSKGDSNINDRLKKLSNFNGCKVVEDDISSHFLMISLWIDCVQEWTVLGLPFLCV